MAGPAAGACDVTSSMTSSITGQAGIELGGRALPVSSAVAEWTAAVDCSRDRSKLNATQTRVHSNIVRPGLKC